MSNARTPPAYTPTLSAAAVESLHRWHEAAYGEMRRRGGVRQAYMGLDLVIPPEVFAPTPMSDLLGQAVLDEVRDRDRVLDMGTGCGVNSLLAASRSRAVVGVDINPHAVVAARANAARNGVGDRTQFMDSNVFSNVSGQFDLMIFDPPFRWFAPRDLLEASIADENYRALTRFMGDAPAHLAPGGRLLLFFGTSGDADYLDRLIRHGRWSAETVANREISKDGSTISYRTQRLSR